MARRAPDHDIDEADLEVGHPKHAAAGVTAVAVSMKRALEQMGVTRTAQTLLQLNQADGFDCPGCAWPDPTRTTGTPPSSARTAPRRSPRRRPTRRVDRGLLRRAQPRRAGRARRLLARPAGPAHRADGQAPRRDALRADLLGRRLRADRRAPARPRLARRGVFYTSGRTSNEAAFAYQLFVRAFGTNNLPDCSNMCHESTGGRAGRDDRHRQGQRHPRRLPRRRADRHRRPEPGHQPPADAHRAGDGQAQRREDPRDQPAARGRAASASATRRTPRGLVGRGTELADLHLPSGSTATWRCSRRSAALLAARRRRRRVDHDFIEQPHRGFEAWAEHLARARLGRRRARPPG